MEILVDRDMRTPNATTSTLSLNGAFECFILEDVDRGLKHDMPLDEIARIKVHGKTCIPSGRYEVTITFSDRFQKPLPLLMNVPGFAGIRIHSGNVAADTEGCLLPGQARAHDSVSSSRAAFAPLFAKIKAALKQEKVFITVQ